MIIVGDEVEPKHHKLMRKSMEKSKYDYGHKRRENKVNKPELSPFTTTLLLGLISQGKLTRSAPIREKEKVQVRDIIYLLEMTGNTQVLPRTLNLKQNTF